LDRSDFLYTRIWIDRGQSAAQSERGAVHVRDPVGQAVKALTRRIELEACRETFPTTIFDWREAYGFARSAVDDSKGEDEYLQFLFGLELMRITWLGNVMNVEDPTEASSQIDEIAKLWAGRIPKFVPYDFRVSEEHDAAQLTKLQADFDLIKSGMVAGKGCE
jgi:hypothetical protein